LLDQREREGSNEIRDKDHPLTYVKESVEFIEREERELPELEVESGVTHSFAVQTSVSCVGERSLLHFPGLTTRAEHDMGLKIPGEGEGTVWEGSRGAPIQNSVLVRSFI
jgi:hypothetical protein